jgi:isocitrate dehydrogenase
MSMTEMVTTLVRPNDSETAAETQPAARSEMRTAVTLAYGDGIGPEIMRASLEVLAAAGARLEVERVELGQAVYERGFSAGIMPQAWESLRRTGVLFKAPISTPQGGGFKSLNVTLRKTLGMFANVRPCVAYHPVIATRHSTMDVVIVRENEEDLYAGIEHRQTRDVYQALKLITRPGCERIVRYAFDYARAHGRKKVTCFTKDNIMKLTDGLFHRVFDETGAEYPDLAREHMIVDIGAARLADTPEIFDVIVMPNLYGDILSDVAAQITGSVGLGASANIGTGAAMFEAIHGSAPDLAGQDKANPSGLLLSGVMMLNHLGQRDVAERIHNAWLRTIEEGVHTPDLYRDGRSRELVGTRGFARAVVERLGKVPEVLAPVDYASAGTAAIRIPDLPARRPVTKEIVGVDMFVEWNGEDAELLAKRLEPIAGPAFQLQMITNRGVKVWPNGIPETLKVDHWRCRFVARAEVGEIATHRQIAELMMRASDEGIDVIKTENLCIFDGEPGFSLGQGQ